MKSWGTSKHQYHRELRQLSKVSLRTVAFTLICSEGRNSQNAGENSARETGLCKNKVAPHGRVIGRDTSKKTNGNERALTIALLLTRRGIYFFIE